MKITKSQLKQIIKEELGSVLNEIVDKPSISVQKSEIKPCDIEELSTVCERGTYSGVPARKYHREHKVKVILLKNNRLLKDPMSDKETQVMLQDGTSVSIVPKNDILWWFRDKGLAVVATKK